MATSSKPELRTLSRGPSIERFFGRYLRFPSGRRAGEPFVMEPWQSAFTKYFHQVDEAGNRIFRLGFLGIPRGNGKSPLAAGYGLYETLARRDRPEIYCISASKDLANIVHTFARSFVEQGPLQKHGVRPGRHAITYPKGQAKFEALPASGALTTGRSAATFFGDELWAFTQQVHRETWIQMFSTLHKRDNPYALGITTAGYDKDTLLGESYDEALTLPESPIKHSNPCLRIHEDRENGILLWWYGIPEELQGGWDNPELWRNANPATWLNVADLKKQLAAPGFNEAEFQRLHLNMWTSAVELWLPMGVWQSLAGKRGKFKKGSPIWVGVDIGHRDDSSAVVWATRLADGRIAIRAKVWTTRTDQVGEYVPGGVMKLELVEDFILHELKANYRIREIAYDPVYFGRSSEILERKGCRMVEMPPMHAHVAAAWEEFKQRCFDGTIEHDGDEVLAAHVAAAGVQMTANGPRVRKNASGKIDALAAAVLAVSRCDLKTRPSAKRASVFWMNPTEPDEGLAALPDDSEE
jgi:phage terminase large subunit-like protein